MVKRLLFLLSMAALCAAFVSAQESRLTIPVNTTPAYDGKQMFVSYCASCHGLDGRGHGPTAAALRMPPTNLTQLAKNNNGVFPAMHVAAVLKFGSASWAHGSKEMPVWGPTLADLNQPNASNDGTENLRISNLVKYIDGLQAK
jgi:mono/diheme cytochrome c family protein